MSAARVVLGLCALLFGAAAVTFGGFPSLLSAAGIKVTSSTAQNEVRAVYGGLELGVAFTLGLCAWRESRVRIGLILAENDPGALDTAKTHWLEDECWQPMRALVEEAMVTKDWFELHVLQNFLIDGGLYPGTY